MEFLNLLQAPTVRLWLAQSMVIFFVIAGLALFAFGICLLLNSAAALRLIGWMNRWVSFRQATKPLEVPRDSRPFVNRHRFAFAAVFFLGGAFALYGLLLQFDAQATIRLLGLNVINVRAAGWLVDSLRWALVLGNALAVVAAVMLVFFPERVAALEALGGRWVSSRKATKSVNDMHVALDGRVAAAPRRAGILMIITAVVMIAGFGWLATGLW